MWNGTCAGWRWISRSGGATTRQKYCSTWRSGGPRPLALSNGPSDHRTESYRPSRPHSRTPAALIASERIEAGIGHYGAEIGVRLHAREVAEPGVAGLAQLFQGRVPLTIGGQELGQVIGMRG